MPFGFGRSGSSSDGNNVAAATGVLGKANGGTASSTGALTPPSINVNSGTTATKIDFGVSTLNGGTPATVTVNLTSVSANTVILLSYGAKSATTLGSLEVSSRSNGVSFTITAFGSAVDATPVYWIAIEP